MAEAKSKAFNFSDKMKELEQATTALESDPDLDKGIKHYETGMKLIHELKTYLNEQTNQVEEINLRYAERGREQTEVVDTDETPEDLVKLEDIPF